ncbi:hypothetical protein ACFE04_019787 [Oxalis oulophora]
MHKKRTDGSPPTLPSDILLKVKEIIFEMSDDPFEVSLRDNYELLVDEHQESINRQKLLDEKLNALFKDRLILPAAKVDELYASLRKINAQVYIQRSQQMKLQAPVRTPIIRLVDNGSGN